MTATSDRGVVPVHGSLAVYPRTFDPFTSGHRDLVARARVMFDRIIVLLAVNADERPTAEATTRAVCVRDAMPAAWGNVEVDHLDRPDYRLLPAPRCHGHRPRRT